MKANFFYTIYVFFNANIHPSKPQIQYKYSIANSFITTIQSEISNFVEF